MWKVQNIEPIQHFFYSKWILINILYTWSSFVLDIQDFCHLQKKRKFNHIHTSFILITDENSISFHSSSFHFFSFYLYRCCLWEWMFKYIKQCGCYAQRCLLLYEGKRQKKVSLKMERCDTHNKENIIFLLYEMLNVYERCDYHVNVWYSNISSGCIWKIISVVMKESFLLSLARSGLFFSAWD